MARARKIGITFYPNEGLLLYLESIPSGERSRWINEQLEKHVEEPLNKRIDFDRWKKETVLIDQLLDETNFIHQLMNYEEPESE